MPHPRNLHSPTTPRRILRQAAWGLLCGALVWGCDPEVIVRYIDPPITVEPRPAFDPDHEPYVEVGFYDEQLYVPLETGDSCPVVFGLQGGTWSMPAIRTLGIAPLSFIECSITMSDDGEEVGYAAQDAIFYLAVDGYLEQLAYPIPVMHVAPNEADPIDDLFGRSATLGCSVTDTEGHSETAVVEVVLDEG